MKALFFTALSFVLLLPPLMGVAQMRTNVEERIKEIKNRKVWLQSHEPNEKVIKKLEKESPGQVAEYKQFVEDYHKILMEVFKANWPYTQDVSFKNFEELYQSEKKGGGAEYVEIRFIYGASDYSIDWPIDKGKFVVRHELADARAIVAMEIRLADEAGYQPLYHMALPHKIPTATDFAFLFQYLVWYIDHPVVEGIPYKTAEKSSLIKAKRLRDYKLLVSENDMDEEFDTSTFKAHYKYPYEIVSYEKFGSILSSKQSGYAYLIIYPIAFDEYVVNYNVVILGTAGEPLVFIKTTSNSQWLNNVGYSQVNAKMLDAISKEIDASRQRK